MIRPARPEEHAALEELALRSKAHWGYDEAFMATCRAERLLAVPADGETWVAEDEAGPLGFYTLTVPSPADREAGVIELYLFFLDPRAIGKGLGRGLFAHAAENARGQGFRLLNIESDPNAMGFYEAMGAEWVSEAASPAVPGRRVPVLHYGLGTGSEK
jgi:GNAT superfamily N-acetyltransferase